jgi:hypothetical protein
MRGEVVKFKFIFQLGFSVDIIILCSEIRFFAKHQNVSGKVLKPFNIMTENSNKVNYKTILVTAIVTASLTVATQYFLQNDKLSSEQEYWNKRYRIESIDKINSQRLQIVDELTKELLQLEVKANEIKINTAASKYFTKPEEMKALNDLMVQYHKDLNFFAAKIQMTSLYFGKEVNNLIPIVGKTLELNFQNNLLTKQDGTKISEFDLDFETIDTLTQSRLKLSKAMIEEISKSYELKTITDSSKADEDTWTFKDWMNFILSILTAFLTAYIYELAVNKRKQNKYKKTFSFLESKPHTYDWQHWDIINGKIKDHPIDAFMTLKYSENKNFALSWKEPGADKVQGDGHIFWDDLTHGKMSFHRYESLDYDYRNVFYRQINHQEKSYDAIFVNADDEKKKFVMLREKKLC